MSPTIQLAVNGKMLSAILNTGSEITLIKKSTVSRLNFDINQKQTVPILVGVTGSPLRLLGAVRVTIAIGYQMDSPQWVPVVPDNYLDTDMLLGVNVLNKATWKWDADNQTVMWGGATYPIRSIPPCKIKSYRKIKPAKTVPATIAQALRVSRKITIPPGHNGLTKVGIKEKPGTTVLIEPYPRARQVC